MLYRVRKQLVEEGFETVLSRKQRATPAVARIFDGEKEAKLIALACSKPPKGRARWTLRLLENKVVELGIVDCASDSTIHCDLRASTSAVRQADRLRGAAHPVVNIRTSEHHIPSRLSVRMFGSWGKKRANASSKCAAQPPPACCAICKVRSSPFSKGSFL